MNHDYTQLKLVLKISHRDRVNLIKKKFIIYQYFEENYKWCIWELIIRLSPTNFIPLSVQLKNNSCKYNALWTHSVGFILKYYSQDVLEIKNLYVLKCFCKCVVMIPANYMFKCTYILQLFANTRKTDVTNLNGSHSLSFFLQAITRGKFMCSVGNWKIMFASIIEKHETVWHINFIYI